jgi:hypothetical protein
MTRLEFIGLAGGWFLGSVPPEEKAGSQVDSLPCGSRRVRHALVHQNRKVSRRMKLFWIKLVMRLHWCRYLGNASGMTWFVERRFSTGTSGAVPNPFTVGKFRATLSAMKKDWGQK